MATYPLAYLVVEGQNDARVIDKLKPSANFEILSAGSDDKALQLFEAKVKQIDVVVVGIVLDADQDKNISTRKAQIENVLRRVGYITTDTIIQPKGSILFPDPKTTRKPKLGIWIMPNNQQVGMLEDFVAQLIPNDDQLAPYARNILSTIEAKNLQKYPTIHNAKAFIHTWLAWQERPGLPMGAAITAQFFAKENELAKDFVAWLNRLFNA